MYKSKLTLIVLSSLLLLVVSTAFAGPKITKVELGQEVADDYYVVALDTSNPWTIKVGFPPTAVLNGIWVNPGETSGDENTTVNSSAANVSAAGMLDAGDKSVYPALLISLPVDTSQMTSELSSLVQNLNPVESANEAIAQIPTNMDSIDLSRAIPAGTEVTFTVDMDGEPFHMLAVMGGTEPVVTYDASKNDGKGEVTIQSTTFSAQNAAGQELNSIIGFMLVTNSQGGTKPLSIIIQTNIWGGDVLPFPAMTGGTMGTVNTMLGLTVYGPVSESRDINVFFPDHAIDPVFGSGSDFQPSDLAMFFESEQQDSVTITPGVHKLDVSGTDIAAAYTFSSPSERAYRTDTSGKNVSVGIRSDAEVSVVKDVDGDRKAGLAEVIHILQTLTESEPSEETR